MQAHGTSALLKDIFADTQEEILEPIHRDGVISEIRRPISVPDARLPDPNEDLRRQQLLKLAADAGVVIPDHIDRDKITLELITELMGNQKPSVLWSPPPVKAHIGAPPTEYDHHTRMLVRKLFF